MLPSHNSASLSLADVLPSCLASLGVAGVENSLGLSDVTNSVVVVVDGLGVYNITHAKAHARFLARATQCSPNITTVFPSTTASALASLTTGVQPGKHGMLGYKIKNPDSGHILNMLKDLSQVSADSWLGAKPLYKFAGENDISVSVVSHSRFASTPLTRVIHDGARMVDANSFDDRINAVTQTLNRPGKQLVVLYFSELDELAHAHGVSSHKWSEKLEDLDRAIETLVSRLDSETGLLLTADHGIVDVPPHNHVLFGQQHELLAGIEAIGGEPRCLQLYLDSSVSRSVVVERWLKAYGEIAWVLDQATAIDAGLLSEITESHAHRVGDVLVLARENVAFYDIRDSSMAGRNMIGQHGGISAEEMMIPCAVFAGYL